jgi:hypothetical protein
MVATLTHFSGVHNLALAEDVVQDAFCRALENCQGFLRRHPEFEQGVQPCVVRTRSMKPETESRAS